MESTIWTEKYRPSTFEDMKGQQHVVNRIKSFVEQKNMPHLLFSGPAGVGKTTLSLIIAKQLFGESWRSNFLELNASDERGIDIVRVKVKDFARTRAIGDVPFKIIYLDECLGQDSIITVKISNKVIKTKIGDFIKKPNPLDFTILSVDNKGSQVYVPITKAIKIPHKAEEGFYRLVLHNKEINITGNHQVITLKGWKKIKELKPGDMVLCPLLDCGLEPPIFSEPINYSLIGLPQEIRKKEHYISNSPEKKVIELLAKYDEGLTRGQINSLSELSSPKLSSILSDKLNQSYIALAYYKIISKEENKFKLNLDKSVALNALYKIKREQNHKNYSYIEDELKHKGLFPIQQDKALILARILGHLFSDGGLSLKTKQLFFSGKENDMKNIRKDLNSLGFNIPGEIRYKKWKNGECWSFSAYKISLLSLFYSLGAPVGKKTDIPYSLPRWIIKGNNQIKREFLSSFFGGEGCKPSFQNRTIKPIAFAQAKRIDLKKELFAFLDQMHNLLSDFGIESNYKVEDRIKNVRSDGTSTVNGLLWVKNSRKNIIRFLEQIGYTYCEYKQDLSLRTLHYLKWKESLGKFVYTFKPIPYFKEWSEKYLLGNSAYFYVTKLEKIPDPDYVYCLSTANQKFIANDIIVHNCDALTKEAQQALRRTMENFTKTCRFVLSCNYSSKIIDPIQSRCAVFKFKPLPKEDINIMIEKIAKTEGFSIEKEASDALYLASNGDARKVTNILQSCLAVAETPNNSKLKEISADLIYTLASQARPQEVKEFLDLALKQNFQDARRKLLDTMLNYGLSGLDIIKQIETGVWDLDLENRKKVELIDKCGEIEFRLVEGSDEYIQLEALLAFVMLLKIK